MKAPNTIYHNATVTRDRWNQLNGHTSIVNGSRKKIKKYINRKYSTHKYNKKELLNQWLVVVGKL
jgi:hypothetical protein